MRVCVCMYACVCARVSCYLSLMTWRCCGLKAAVSLSPIERSTGPLLGGELFCAADETDDDIEERRTDKMGERRCRVLREGRIVLGDTRMSDKPAVVGRDSRVLARDSAWQCVLASLLPFNRTCTCFHIDWTVPVAWSGREENDQLSMGEAIGAAACAAQQQHHSQLWDSWEVWTREVFISISSIRRECCWYWLLASAEMMGPSTKHRLFVSLNAGSYGSESGSTCEGCYADSTRTVDTIRFFTVVVLKQTSISSINNTANRQPAPSSNPATAAALLCHTTRQHAHALSTKLTPSPPPTPLLLSIPTLGASHSGSCPPFTSLTSLSPVQPTSLSFFILPISLCPVDGVLCGSRRVVSEDESLSQRGHALPGRDDDQRGGPQYGSRARQAGQAARHRCP